MIGQFSPASFPHILVMLNPDRSQLVVRSLTESESSADKAFRSHSPIPQASSKRLVLAEGSSAAGESLRESAAAAAGWAGEKEAEVERGATVGTGSQGEGETEDSSQEGEAAALVRAARSGVAEGLRFGFARSSRGLRSPVSAFRCRVESRHDGVFVTEKCRSVYLHTR